MMYRVEYIPSGKYIDVEASSLRKALHQAYCTWGSGVPFNKIKKTGERNIYKYPRQWRIYNGKGQAQYYGAPAYCI